MTGKIKAAVGTILITIIVVILIWGVAITRYEYLLVGTESQAMRIDRWSGEVFVLKKGELKMPQDGNPSDWPVTGYYYSWSKNP